MTLINQNKICKKFSYLFIPLILFSLFHISGSFGQAEELTINTSLKQGTLQKNAELEFFYNIRYRDEAGKLNYITPEKVYVNNKYFGKYGNTYKGNLDEGENKIVIKYLKGTEEVFDVYDYYLDSTPPYVNVKGIYDHMLSDSRNISFSIITGDAQSEPEAISLRAYLNGKELRAYNGSYKGILTSSYPNYKQQKEVTEDNHFTNNDVKIVVKDGLGNEATYIYNVIYKPKKLDYSQLRYLVEKVPGLVPESTIYKNTSERYSDVGVALDDSNITILGTYGGYVVLGHDTPIINGPADDILVNAHWSDAGYPLTSIMVMQDSNHNHIPDDTWYYIDDLDASPKEVINHKISYSFAEKGRVMDVNGNVSELVLKIPVKTPFATPYLQMAKDIYKNRFTGSYYSLYANLRRQHEDMIDSVSLKTKGYDISDAKDINKNPVTLDSVDFVKVYTNTLDTMEGIGSVMPAVNYVRVNEDLPLMLNCDSDYLSYESLNLGAGDVLTMNLEAMVSINYSRVRPQLNEDFVFVYPESNYDDTLPYKIENNKLVLFYPYERSTLTTESLVDSVSNEINILTQLTDRTDKMATMGWLELIDTLNNTQTFLHNDINLSTAYEGKLELLRYQLDSELTQRLTTEFANIYNSYAYLKRLKWEVDYLSDDYFDKIPVVDRLDLENRLLEMLAYKKESFTFEPSAGDRYTITPIRNIAYNMSVEEIERFVKPRVSIYAVPNGGDNLRLTFNIDFFKESKESNALYRPISYNLLLTRPWTEGNKLLSVSGDERVEIPVTVTNEGYNVNFETNRLGIFTISN